MQCSAAVRSRCCVTTVTATPVLNLISVSIIVRPGLQSVRPGGPFVLVLVFQV